jgi:hypothetical protein
VKSRLQRAAALYLVTRFEFAAEYSERQVNAILEDWHTFRDPARLRRTLVDWGYLDRESDGSRYGRIDPAAE